MQAEADAQATVFRKVNCAPAGLGVGWMLQLVPFHRSARFPASEFPTAVHADGEVQATPSRNAPPCGGLAVAWMLQRVPSHRSASVPAAEPPTAVQTADDVHATPDRNAPAGLGAGWSCQLLPFHPSARGFCAPDLLAVVPTASQADGDPQDTPNKLLHAVPGGLGIGWMRHLLPFHRSASVTPAPEALV